MKTATLPAGIPLYDSDQARRPLVSEVGNLWAYRGLLRLLVHRDITVRYKRSVLGVWWTLLNPLLTTAVMWIVFGHVFRLRLPGNVPFVVYLLSGILLVTFFLQAVTACGGAIVNSSGILTKVYVPPEVFALASSTAAATNFTLSLVPLLLLQLLPLEGLSPVGIPWTVVLVPLPVLCLLALVTGLGLVVAAVAVFFYDVLDLTAVLLTIVGYLTPSFYPVDIVPEQLRIFIYANPLYSYLEVFRGFVYGGTFAPGWNFAVMLVSAPLVLLLGVFFFSRSWKRLVVLL